MAIEIEKPAPLMIGDKAYYTLTSYDPVHIELEIPATTEGDVDLALEAMVRDAGGTVDDLADDRWVAAHFDGVQHAASLRDSVRAQISDMTAQMTEEQKVGLCVAELSKRLRQAVPAAHVAQARSVVEAQFAQSIEADGMTVDEFLTRTGTSKAQLSAMLDRQAKDAAESNAALDAFAHERKLTVDDSELPRLLRVPASEAERLQAQARAAGQLDQLREAALRNKAAEALVAECTCVYRHETPENAERRARQMREMRDRLAGAASKRDASSAPSASGNSAGLHLV